MAGRSTKTKERNKARRRRRRMSRWRNDRGQRGGTLPARDVAAALEEQAR